MKSSSTTITARCARAAGAAVILLLVAAPAAGAQARDTTTGAREPAREAPSAVSDASPRASLERYLELARAGRFAEAASYLDMPDSMRAEGPALARRLKAVLDRHAWLDMDAVSGLAAGDTADGLPPVVEQVALIRDREGVARPVRLARAALDGESRWRFTRGTVASIPIWYAGLEDRWLLERLPAGLLRPGPLEILWWQWMALPIVLAVAVLIGVLMGRLIRPLFTRLTSRTSSEWDDAVFTRLGAPLSAACTLAVVGALLPWLGLYEPAALASYRALRAGFLIIVFWALWRLVDVARQVVMSTRWARSAASSRSLVPLGARVAKVIVGAFAAVAVLSLLGYPVASLVAGLGLGGLALALAAQKTVENMFGAFSLGVDQPFREGDFVRVEDFVGTVEAIGLRSTRFRTLDRTVVSLPNGKLADMRLESFAARDRMRLAAVIGLVYETTAVQMREVLAGFERVLREHPKLWPGALTVRFREFAASSLDIEVMAWFETPEWSEFQLIRQEILLQFMEVVERAGTSFAFPTQTVHLAGSVNGRARDGNGEGAGVLETGDAVTR